MSTETGNPQSSRRLNLKEVKEAPSVDEDSVGMELRAMRLQRGETIAQISQVLRIRKDMVEALEQGRHDLLPGHAYEVGFVRAYADHLRLDTADVVRRYKAEMSAQGQPSHLSVMVPEDEQRFSALSVLIILACLLLAAGGAWYLARQQGWIGGSRSVGPAPVGDNGVSDTSTTPAPDGLEPGPTTPPVAVVPTPQTVPAAPGSEPPTAPAAGVPGQPPVPAAPGPVAEAAPTPETRPGGIVPPQPGEQAQAATGNQMGKANSAARIVFISRRPAVMSISSSRLKNTLYINRTFQPGDSYRVPNTSGLMLQMSDAGAFDVMLDGQFIGHAGADGAAVNNFALSPEAYGAAPSATPAPAPSAAPSIPSSLTPPSATPASPSPGKPATPAPPAKPPASATSQPPRAGTTPSGAPRPATPPAQPSGTSPED